MVRQKSAASASPPARSEPLLTVTAQQSRFHVDADANTGSKEIVVKDLSISIGDHEVLSHEDLHFQPGRRYVLVGRNGVGKSTLLRAIASGTVPGISSTVRVLLLAQSQTATDPQSLQTTDEVSVLQRVIMSDEPRECLVNEAKRLSGAIETNDPDRITRVYRQLVLERLQTDVAEAREIDPMRYPERSGSTYQMRHYCGVCYIISVDTYCSKRFGP
jgi:ATP-binding cassette, subfamily F, member 3